MTQHSNPFANLPARRGRKEPEADNPFLALPVTEGERDDQGPATQAVTAEGENPFLRLPAPPSSQAPQPGPVVVVEGNPFDNLPTSAAEGNPFMKLPVSMEGALDQIILDVEEGQKRTRDLLAQGNRGAQARALNTLANVALLARRSVEFDRRIEERFGSSVVPSMMQVFSRGADFLVQRIGGSKLGAFELIENSLRDLAERTVPEPAGDELSFTESAIEAAGALPLDALTFVTAFATTGPIGLSLLGAVREAEGGEEAMLRGATLGLAEGTFFRFLEGLVPKVPVSGARKPTVKIREGETLRLTPEGPEVVPLAPAVESRAGRQALDVEVRAQPAAEIAAPPGALPRRAGNINLDRLNTPEEIKATIARVAEQEGKFLGARRGRISLAETERLADDMGLTVEQLLKRRRGQAFNAEEATAARRLLVQSADDLTAKSQKAIGGSDADLVAFEEALTRHIAVQEQVAGLTAEAGRALSAFRIQAATQRARQQAFKNIIDARGGREKLETLATTIAAMDDPRQVAAYARRMGRAKFSDKFFEWWINGLLSNPATHAVNVTSNTLAALLTIPESALAATLGLLRRGDRVVFGEVAARTYGFLQGALEGIAVAPKVFFLEEALTQTAKIEARAFRAIPSLKIGKLEVGGKQVRIPGRLLSAEDAVFRAIGYRMELNARAVRQATLEGKRGRAFAERVEEIKRNPPPEIREAAESAGSYLTFTERLGAIGQGVFKLTRAIPVGRVVLPFIRTPGNLTKFAVERSPLGFAMREVKANLAGKNGKAVQDTQRARMALGTLSAVTVAQLAARGHITGGGPSDPRLRAQLRNTGWQPYSVRIGDTYYKFNRLDPFAMLMGLTADFVEISGQIGEEAADKIAGAIVFAFSKNLLDKTWLQGPSALVKAIHDTDRYGGRYIQRLAGSLVPAGVAQIERVTDPVLRDAQTSLETIRSRLPGYSSDLPARLNLWGEPIFLEGGLGPDMVSPIYTSTRRQDPLLDEVVRLKLRLSMPSRKIGDLKLTPERYWNYVQLAGRPAKEMLDRLVVSPEWGRLPDDAKEKIIREVVEKFREAARIQIKAVRLIGSTEAPGDPIPKVGGTGANGMGASSGAPGAAGEVLSELTLGDPELTAERIPADVGLEAVLGTSGGSLVEAAGVSKSFLRSQGNLIPDAEVDRVASLSALATGAHRVERKIDALLDDFTRPGNSARAQVPGAIEVLRNFNLADGSFPPAKTRAEVFGKQFEELSALAASPGLLADRISKATAEMAGAASATTAALGELANRAVGFLMEKAPKRPLPAGLSKTPWHPPDADIARWAGYVRAVNDPLTVLEDLAQGAATREGVEALQRVYPALYERIRGKLLERVAGLDDPLPYEKRLQLGALFGAEFEPSLAPGFLVAMQQGYSAQAPDQIPPDIGPGPTAERKKSQRISVAMGRRLRDRGDDVMTSVQRVSES